jgi:hypothetical protein
MCVAINFRGFGVEKNLGFKVLRLVMFRKILPEANLSHLGTFGIRNTGQPSDG